MSIVGAGNWLVACDRVGPRVLQQLAGRYGPEVEVREVGTAALALLDHLRGQQLLVVVDACLLGGEPGAVQVLQPDLDDEDLIGHEASVHQIGPVESLVIARHLYPETLPRRVVTVLVETGGLQQQDEQAACDRAVSLIDREIAAWYRAAGLAPPSLPGGDDPAQATSS